MVRLVPVLLLGFVCCFLYVQALECGIVQQLEEEELQNVLRKCVGSRSSEAEEKSEKNEKTTPEAPNSPQETKHQIPTTSSVVASRIRRNVLSVGFNRRRRESFARERPKTTKRDVANSTSENQHENEDNHHGNQNDTGMSSKCFLQCVFSELGMVDTNGYPEHHHVSEGLLKNAKGRESRDFIQDSADECFQLMEQGNKPDSCDYSTHLVTCFAEKGRSNCADWQIMNLPFHN